MSEGVRGIGEPFDDEAAASASDPLMAEGVRGIGEPFDDGGPAGASDPPMREGVRGIGEPFDDGGPAGASDPPVREGVRGIGEPFDDEASEGASDPPIRGKPRLLDVPGISRAEAGAALAASCLGLLMAVLDNLVLNVALPSITRDLGGSVATLAWMVDAYVLALASCLLVAGALGDRFGRRRVFTAGLCIFTVASAACALAPSAGWLVGGRAVQGVGGALLTSGSLALLNATFAGPRRAHAIGVWTAATSAGIAGGPLLGGFLVEHVGWHSIFWINVPIGIATFALVRLRVREPARDPKARRAPLDGLGLLLGTAALAGVTGGLIEASARTFTDPLVLGLLGIGAIAAALFVRRQRRRADHALVPLDLFRSKEFVAAAVASFSAFFAMFGAVFFLTLYLQGPLGWSPQTAGLAFLPMTLVMAVVSTLTGRFVGRLGARPFIISGLLLLALGRFALVPASEDSSYWFLFPTFMLTGLGAALAMPAMTTVLMGAVPPERSGVAATVRTSTQQIGGLLGIALLSVLSAGVFGSSYRAALEDLPPAVAAEAEALTDTVASGQVEAVAGLPDEYRPEVERAVTSAYVDAFRAVMGAAGVVACLGTLACAVLLRRSTFRAPRPAAMTPDHP